MADIYIAKGNSPEINYMWCEGDASEWKPSYGVTNYEDTPAFDDNYDAAYSLHYFTAGFPFSKLTARYHRRAIESLAAGDIVEMIKVPLDHYATHLNFKSVSTDDNLAGATVQLTCKLYTQDAEGNITGVEDQFIEDALEAQGLNTPIAFDKPFNIRLSLTQVVGTTAASGPVTGTVDGTTVTGTATTAGTASGWALPMYSDPTKGFYTIGMKIVSLPTNTAFTFADLQKRADLCVKLEAFNCPAYL